MVERKRIFGLDPSIYTQMKEAYARKMLANRKAGLQQYADGTMKPFEGYTKERAIRRYNFGVLFFDDDTNREIIERICEPIQRVAEKYGIPSIYTGGEDIVPHLTLQAGTFSDPEDLEAIHRILASSGGIAAFNSILPRIQLPLNDLVLAGSSFYADVQDPAQNATVYRVRQALKRELTHLPVSTPPNLINYDDITHISIGRITDTVPSETLSAFANDVYRDVLPTLQRYPVVVQPTDIFYGSEYDMFKKRAPHLLREQ